LLGLLDEYRGDEPATRRAQARLYSELGLLDLATGDYRAAREKFGQALTMRQQIGDRAGAAATWHGLATIDLNEGDYRAAREKFGQALTMRQQIGDRAGAAATFAQLGILAAQGGRAEPGLRLLVLSALILQALGHADLRRVEPWVNQLIAQLNYSPAQLKALLQEVAAAYQADGGRGLVAAAFD